MNPIKSIVAVKPECHLPPRCLIVFTPDMGWQWAEKGYLFSHYWKKPASVNLFIAEGTHRHLGEVQAPPLS
jgi:hypothetical protein